MTVSKKVTLSADGDTATVADAEIADVFSTIFSTDSCVTGMYGFLQKAVLFGGGLIVGNKRHSGEFFNFGS
jgi:hypothetical protein